MPGLIRFYPGDSVAGFLMVVILAVALASSAGYLISRRLARKAALRHHVLLCALISCLASPVAAWLCTAAGLAVVSVPILGDQAAERPAVLTPVKSEPEVMPSRSKARLSPANADSAPPQTRATTDPIRPVAAPRAISQAPEWSTPAKARAMQSGRPVVQASTFRVLASGAMLVWVAGTLVMLLRLARNCARVVLLRRRSSPLDDARVQILLQEVVSQVGARHAPLVLVSSGTIVPLAVALGRPAVILPKHLLGAINHNELRDILVHEIAHLRRGDPRTLLLQELAGAIYWPIVSVHGLNRELQQAREEVSDNIVLAERDPISYGETLLHVAVLLVEARRMGAAVAMIGGPGRLERRIAGLIDPERNKMTKPGRKTACVVTILFTVCCAFASATRFAAVPVAADEPQSNDNAFVIAAVSDMKIPNATQNENVPRQKALKRSIVLRGKVLGPGEKPITAAHLYLSLDEWNEPVELGTSDTNGAYRFDVTEEILRRTVSPNFVYADCNAALIAAVAGFGPGWVELPAAKGGRMGEMKPEYAHDIHLVADFPIAGRVVDSSGKPVVGAAVAVDRMFELGDPRWRLMHPAIKAGNPFLMTRAQSDTNNWFTPLYPNAWTLIAPAKTDSDGRFRLAGVGADRAIRLNVSGPGVRSATVSVLTRDDVADFTQAIRTKYPRTPRPDGYFYPPRADAPEGDQGVRLFGPSPTIDVDPARTVAGVVRDSSTGEPIAGHRMGIVAGSGYAATETDSRGRYRILRDEAESSIVIYSDQYRIDRYLTVARQLNDAMGFGEIVADFDIPRGVVISGRVVEAGTDRPIVSSPRQGCHDTVPGPLLAGNVCYYPLANNVKLRGAPTGPYFEGFKTGTNYYRCVAIDGDGRFLLAVPPGPGVLFVQASPGLPMFAEVQTWKESDGFHRLFPYVKLKTRSKNDGAPDGDSQSLPGFNGPIPLSSYDAYRVINPSDDAKSLDLTISVPRAPSRTLRFVSPEGRAIRGVTVQGLLAPKPSMTFILDGSDAEVLALEPEEAREVIVTSNDGKYSATVSVTTRDPQLRTVQLKPGR
jgi:beta-lactamase regulating signal transducer with metallopeptidase domain